VAVHLSGFTIKMANWPNRYSWPPIITNFKYPHIYWTGTECALGFCRYVPRAAAVEENPDDLDNSYSNNGAVTDPWSHQIQEKEMSEISISRSTRLRPLIVLSLLLLIGVTLMGYAFFSHQYTPVDPMTTGR